jgi:hypothetical protein
MLSESAFLPITAAASLCSTLLCVQVVLADIF